MDIKQLEYILAIAEEQNITHAAKKLYITRSALNYSLLNLEKELGFPLFKRLQNRLIPTYAGELYISQARQILSSCRELSHTMAALSDVSQRRLNIGVTVGGGQQILMDVFPDFCKKYPHITVHLVEANSRVLEKALLSGEIDMAWSGTIPDNPLIDYILTKPKDRLTLAVPKTNHLAQSYELEEKNNTVIDLRLFKDETFIIMNKNSFIRPQTDEYFHFAGFKPKVLMECSLMGMASHFAASGLALAFVPNSQTDINDRCFRFFVEPLNQTVSTTILYRKGSLFTEVENDLIQRIVQRNR